MDLSHLNSQQRLAVTSTKGKILILAGAGSGKTSVITHRIAYLIRYEGISPKNILGMTFTNKAAKEMRERVAKIIGKEKAKQVALCTFHSFCMKVLRNEIHRLGYTTSFSLYDEKEVKRLLKQLAAQILEHEGELPSIEPTYQMIKDAKSKGEIAKEGNAWHDEFAEKLYEHLEICLRAYNAVDFDSLISLTVKLFREFPEVLKSYQDHYQYIMIDEYQDTNPMQFHLADLLCKKHQNLCVVGDDDQSIYGWRGAEIRHILEFTSTKVIKLEQNYRSTSNILKGANGVIGNNRERHEKKLWSEKGQGELIHLFHAPTDTDEASAVVDRIVHLKQEKGLNWKDVAILYRSNILSRAFEMALMNVLWKKEGSWVRGIPYEISGGTELYQRSEIKDIIAYLRTIVNPNDQEAILRIINFPRRGISSMTLDTLTQENRSQGKPLWDLLCDIASERHPLREKLTSSAKKGIALFIDIIKTAQKKFSSPPLTSALDWLLNEISFKEAVCDEVKSEKMKGFKWENVQHCKTLLSQYEEEEEEDCSLHHFLLTTLLDPSSMQKQKNRGNEDKVSLMTFHSSKGLEFPICFLVGLEDHIMPHEKSIMETGLEEERRLMYVAMTRAKKYLTLSMSRQRKHYGKDVKTTPSRFLFEIPKDLLKVTSWNIPTGYGY